MIDIDLYNSLIMSTLAHEKVEANYKSDIINSLIYSMKNDFEKYNEIIQKQDLDRIKKNEEEYYYYLEGKIRYILKTKYKEVFAKRNHEMRAELELLCKSAINLNEFSLNANYCLFEIRKSQKNYSEALALLRKIHDFGFKTDPIIDNILFVFVITKQWIKYEKFISQGERIQDKFLLKLLLYEFKYHVILIIYAFSSLFLPVMFGWNIALPLILPILFFFILITLIFKRRIYYGYAAYLAIILVYSIGLYFLITLI